MEKVDISTALREGLSEKTMKSQKKAEAMLAEMFEKYSVSEDEQRRLVKALSGYADGIYDDVYGMAIQAGAELGDMRGYMKAVDEAEDVAAGMLAEDLMKR